MKRYFGVFLVVLLTGSFVWALPKSIGEMTAGMERFEGYFNFYYDGANARIWLEIDKFDSEFLYLTSLPAGLGANSVGLSRNSMGRSRIVYFERIGQKVLMVQPNYSFRADSDDPYERKAVEDAFPKSVIWGFEIEAEENDKVLVDGNSLILRDAQNVIGTLRRANQGDYRLDLSRSAVYKANTKNFPDNTELEVILTFAGSGSGADVREVTPDPEAITLRQHHSFIKLPDDRYRPRKYDPRASFGDAAYMDFAAPIDQPLLKRFIRRHRLEKKDPGASVSDPVKPIVYYVDRGTPEPLRTALVEGARWWNEAFEAIGYRNAFQVELLPEGADPLDIRYNIINWIHRSTRGWSSGGSVTDPRTGEILKGTVTLGSQRVRQDFLIAQALAGEYEDGRNNNAELLEMALLRIRQLSCHEVGHTLGLGHNYASSVNDRASVMDYPHPLIKIREDGSLDFSDAYTRGVGEWDKVAIAYGYQDFPEGVDEDRELDKILNDAFSRGLLYLTNQDSGTHPLNHPWDNGTNAVDELERVMRIRSIALNSFSEKRIPIGFPMATLEEALVPAYLFHRYQIEATAAVVGGLYYNHAVRGGTQKLPEIASPAEQRRALEALLAAIRPENLVIDTKILDLIPPRPPGFSQTPDLFPGYTGITFDPLAAAESVASIAVSALLDSERAARLLDYHSRNNDNPGLEEVLDTLVSTTWKSPAGSDRHGEIQRGVNYVVLYHVMRLAADEGAAPQVRAVAMQQLESLKKWIEGQAATADGNQEAMFGFARAMIVRFQEDPGGFVFQGPLRPPAGAPIGGIGPG